MTATYQPKIIDDKIEKNQAKYDLGRLAAKISALSSGELRKYEYFTGEDFGYQPSVLEQKRLDHCPLGKTFNKGLVKVDQKEGLFKRLKNISNKNKDQLELFSKANKTTRLPKNESDYNYDNNEFALYEFYRDLEKGHWGLNVVT